MTSPVRRVPLLLLALAASTVASLGLASPVGHAAAPGSAATVTARNADPRPNIVFITTDDQRASDLQWMPHTRRLLGGRGFNFTEALSPHPLCCPARAEYMTGQYGQNNGVHHNTGVRGGYQALLDPSNTLGRWLHTAGYRTAMVGKYMNGYAPDAASVVGWEHWNPSVRGVYSYVNTTFHNDGEERLHTSHVDDVVTRYAAGYIREFAAGDAPFFVWASNLAPHERSRRAGKWLAPRAALRHRGTLQGARFPAARKPSYGVPVVGGLEPTTDATRLATMSDHHVARIESLQAVDEGVRDIVATLRETGELANTYIVFTSDNGYLLGEHGLTGKNHIYSEALRVPLLVRVPGPVTEGVRSPVPVTTVDLAPTIADLAGAIPERRVDGTSFARLLGGRTQPWRDTQLIQTGAFAATELDPSWQVRGVRTSRWTYGLNQQTGLVELYDRRDDPFELVNLANRAEYVPVVTELQLRTAALQSCAGEACDLSFGSVPEPLPPDEAR